MRIFLDANILFSGAQSGSPMQQMLVWLEREHTLITSEYAWTEAARNVAAKRPAWNAVLKDLHKRLELVTACVTCDVPDLDAADRPILGAAMAARCSHLLTGDFQHFGRFMGQSINSVKIVSSRLLAEECRIPKDL